MSWILVGAACGALASSAVTLAVMAETEPYINEEGEEEYSVKGYILLAGATVLKWGFKKLLQFIGHKKMKVQKEPLINELRRIEKEDREEKLSEFELFV